MPTGRYIQGKRLKYFDCEVFRLLLLTFLMPVIIIINHVGDDYRFFNLSKNFKKAIINDVGI